MKIIFQFYLLGLLVVCTMAQDILEQNTQELESQKKVSQISQDFQVDLNSKINSMSKNGFFLGFEGNLGQTTLTSTTNLVNTSEFSFRNSTTKTPVFSFDGGVKLGYQHYFGEQKDWGLRLGGYAGMGTPISQDFRVDFKDSPSYKLFSQSYLPLKLGIDLDVLWDFWKQGGHTLGLTLGMSYRLSYYQSIKNSKNFKEYDFFLDQQNSIEEIFFSNAKLSSPIIHSIVPQIGLHYYLGHHQFEFSYRFGGMISWEKNYKNRFSNALINDPTFESEITPSENTSISNTNYLVFSYVYLF